MGDNGDAERYKEALYDAFQQLDWCIGYLHGIRKVEVATVLAKNRRHIAQSIESGGDEPMPTAETSE